MSCYFAKPIYDLFSIDEAKKVSALKNNAFEMCLSVMSIFYDAKVPSLTVCGNTLPLRVFISNSNPAVGNFARSVSPYVTRSKKFVCKNEVRRSCRQAPNEL